MPIEIVGGNLNTWGGSGQFEVDRSTWGAGFSARNIFWPEGPFVDFNVSRSSEQAKAGIYSAKVSPTGAAFPANVAVVACASHNVKHGKKYIARCWVYVPNANQIAPDDWQIAIAQNHTSDGGITPFNCTFVSEIKKTIAECKGSWQQLEFKFTVAFDSPGSFPDGATAIRRIYLIPPDATVANHYGFLNETIGGDPYVLPTLNASNALYLDQFEIYEYIDVTPSCTLSINVPGSSVDHATGPLNPDGVITVEVAGNQSLCEYSKDGGDNWQGSNVFSGLLPGSYTIIARETGNLSCTASHAFVVNGTPTTPEFSFSTVVTPETSPSANNAIIEVNVTGDYAPFEYSKNGGSTYQAFNIFSSLAPGVYNIVVRDSFGLMVAAIVEVPPSLVNFTKAYFSKNWIPLVKEAQAGYEELNNYRIYCETYVLNTDSNQYESVFKQDLPVTTEGGVTFNLRRAFENVLTANVHPAPIIGLTVLSDRIKFFKNKTGHLQNAEITPSELTESPVDIVLLGGISKFHYPTMRYFDQYLPTSKKFMTWAPVEKVVDRLQEDYLNFWVYSATISVLKLKIKAYFDDSSVQTITKEEYPGVIKGMLFCVPAGPVNLSVATIDVTKTVVKYELWLEDQGDNVISEVRTYKVRATRHPRTRYIMILNSLGAYEVHLFNGVSQVSEQYSRSVVQKLLTHQFDGLEGEMENNEVTGQRTYSLSSGFFSGKYAREWQEYMRDLVRTTRMFDITSGARLPLIVTSTRFDHDEDQNYERFIRVEAVEAFVNENYTPDKV